MKPWGLSGRGALLVVLLLVVSGAVIPLGARGQANVVSGRVNDCAPPFAPVGADVALVDVHAPSSERTTTASPFSGSFTFPNVQPSYYILRVRPNGFTHFHTESAPFRVDGITDVLPQKLCVDKMLDKTRNLEVTVVDAATNTANETVTFQEFGQNDNVTFGEADYNEGTATVTLSTSPLGWDSEILTYSDNTTPIGGIPLQRGPAADYDYNEADAYSGVIHIINTTVATKLKNAKYVFLPDDGFLEITYKNVSKSSQLSNGQISSSSFYKNENPINSSTVQLNNETGSLVLDRSDWKYGSASGADELRAVYTWSGAINGADVTVRFAPRDQAISDTIRTPVSGKAFFSVWGNADFEVRVEATEYLTALVSVTVGGLDVDKQIPMSRGYKVWAYAYEGSVMVTSAQGLTGVLINTNSTVNKGVQVLKATVVDNLLIFTAYNGSWKLIADANGRKAVTRDVLVNGVNVLLDPDIFFQKSSEEPIRTEINFFADSDWNNITVWRNMTLLPDSSLPGLSFPEVRDIRWQLDLNFGNRNGSFDPGTELPVFQQRLQNMSTFYVVTDNLITVNGRAYNSSRTSYFVLVTDLGPANGYNITTRANYTVKNLATGAIPANKPRYFVNVTTIADKNVSVYQNFTYRVLVPKGYEMTSKTTTGNVVTRDFVAITLDPGIDAVVPNPKANLVIERSLTGVARAEVEGPAGKVFVKDSDQDKYLAWVANDTAIVFSANKTSDRQNEAINAKDANFTWRFNLSGGAEVARRYGIWTTYDFGSGGANYTVNLTVTQVNPDNRTFRQINVTVDNIGPVAVILTNRTTDEPTTLTVKEDLVTRFDGGNSSDLLWGTLKGEIGEWNWDFDSDGTTDRTGRVVTFNYSTPGTFKANLTVVDRVGHKSMNDTLEVTVLDTTAPAPDLSILDENNSWRVVTQSGGLTEKKGYWFNVSRTTDNSLNRTEDNVNLTYTYTWGDGSNKTGPMNGSAALNVSHTYTKHGEYNISINVTDRARNTGWLNRSLIVQANTSAHPDLSIIAGSLTFAPTSPEEFQLVTFTLKVENGEDRADATSLRFKLVWIDRGRDVELTDVRDLRYLNPDGTPTTRIDAGENVTVEFKWASPTLGNKTLRIEVWDDDEPEGSVGNANKITTSLLVREAGFRIWIWIGAFLFIIVGLPTIYYVIRKYRAGELRLRRRREEVGEEEEEEEEEADEDEEEEGGKKRL